MFYGSVVVRLIVKLSTHLVESVLLCVLTGSGNASDVSRLRVRGPSAYVKDGYENSRVPTGSCRRKSTCLVSHEKRTQVDHEYGVRTLVEDPRGRRGNDVRGRPTLGPNIVTQVSWVPSRTVDTTRMRNLLVIRCQYTTPRPFGT